MNVQRADIHKVEFRALGFQYETGSGIFNKVDFQFPLDRFVWVRALENGSGRSTLLQILAGLVAPKQGQYLLGTTDVADLSFEEFLPYRLNIGYAFDMGGLLHNRTLFENLTLPLLYHKFCSASEANDRVMSLMTKMGIERYRDQRPSVVQGSVRKLTCLLRPLLIEPQMLLLDEPSFALGQETVGKYFELVHELRKSAGLRHIFVTSGDEKLMAGLENEEIFVGYEQIVWHDKSQPKKVVHL